MTRILLVDDDDAFRPALQKTLEALGYNVTADVNGLKAKERLAQASFDLVISDIRMPEMDGIALMKHIKETYSGLPVVLITGFAEILETHEAHELGADEFIPKPFERDDLTAAISRCLAKKQATGTGGTATGAASGPATTGSGSGPTTGGTGASAAPFTTASTGTDGDYCRLGIEDFTSGRQILFNIFIRLAEDKFVKIAYRGEDLPLDRIRKLKKKGVNYLYLQRKDFRTYVGFSIEADAAICATRIPPSKKLALLRRTGELLLEQLRVDGLDADLFDCSAAFVQSAVEVLSEDPDVFELLDVLNQHTDYLYAHSLGTSLYSVMIAQKVDWKLPTNKFKVAMGGLLHDIGQKEVDPAVLMMPRQFWTVEQVILYETHPIHSINILSDLRSTPGDVLQIASQHHEDCLSQGYPRRPRKSLIHPMARLVGVANLFCERVVRNPHHAAMPPREAVHKMAAIYGERLDPVFFAALKGIFTNDA